MSNYRQLVWIDTQYQFQSGKYKDLVPELSLKCVYDEDYSPPEVSASSCIIEVVDTDTISALIELQEIGEVPLVLNMACESGPGGGVESGALAQEEDIFRVSNYYMTASQEYYPISDATAIYSPSVQIIKDSKYSLLESPIEAPFIAVSAVKKPHHRWGLLLDDEELELTKKKIELIFQVAHKFGHTSLLLGALGCGAYGNPPRHIANIFREALERWCPCFERITFAILDNKTIEATNYNIFRKCIVEGMNLSEEETDQLIGAEQDVWDLFLGGTP